MILRPVSPASPSGPPISNAPVGLMWNTVSSDTQPSGSTSRTTPVT